MALVVLVEEEVVVAVEEEQEAFQSILLLQCYCSPNRHYLTNHRLGSDRLNWYCSNSNMG